jgi:hypothetical protein
MLVLGIGLLGLSAREARGGASGDPVTIASPGVWTLQRLGSAEQHVSTTAGQNLVRVPFSLPGAVAERSHDCYRRDGPAKRTCFLIHLHFRIKFAENTASGNVKVSAATNRLTASQVLFTLRRSGDRLAVDWSTLNLIRGYEPRSTSESLIEVEDTNYLQTQGLQAGANTLDFQLDAPDGTIVQQLDVLADSGLEWTSEPPGRLALSLLPVQPTRVGHTFKVRYRVRLVSGHDLENVTVLGRSLSPSIRTAGASSREIGRLSATLAGSFAFRAKRAGTFKLQFHVKSGTTLPTKTIRVRVLPVR